MEKRVYTKGYHISWLHPINLDALQDVAQDAMQDASQDVAQDASQELSQNLPKDLSKNLSSNLPQDLSKNLSSNLSKNLSKNQGFQTPSDTITPTTKDEALREKKRDKQAKEKIRPYFQYPIQKPKTVEELKLAITFDFRLVLAAFLLILILGGLIYLGYLVSFENLGVGIVLYLSALASVLAFFFYLLRGILRTLKLVALKIFRKSDEARINKHKKRRVRESEHQVFRRILLGLGQFFRFLLQPSFGSKVVLFLIVFAIAMGIITISH
jgi:hypothetical protein